MTSSTCASISLINDMVNTIKRSLFSESTANNFVANNKSSMAVERCQKLKKEMSVFQSKLMELESQKEEAMMELTIQSKLLRAQIRDAEKNLFESYRLVNDLSRKADEYERKINNCMVKQLQQHSEAEKKITTYRQILEGCISEMHRRRLYMRVESIENDEERKQYRMSIVNQTIEMRAMQKRFKTMEKTLSDQEAELRSQKEQIMVSRSVAMVTKSERQAYAIQLQNQLEKVGRVGNEKLLVLNTGIHFLTLFVNQSNNLLAAVDDAIKSPPASSSKEVVKLRRATWGYSGDGQATSSGAAVNLRAYIESGGHRLNEFSDDLLMEKWSIRGFLEKLSGATGDVGDGTHSRRNKWLKRWFVLDRQSKTLSYYHEYHKNNADNPEAMRDEDGGEGAKGAGGRSTWSIIRTKKKMILPRASIEFQDILGVFFSHTYNKTKDPGTTFVVNTTSRAYHLSASTQQAARTWMDAILTVLNSTDDNDVSE